MLDSNLNSDIGRLRYLAKIYEPSTLSLLISAMNNIDIKPELVIDLGAGLGYTTALLGKITGGKKVIGLERSKRLCAQALKRALDRTMFIIHDVNNELPLTKVNIAYCRFLLSHIFNPVIALAKWRQALRFDGLLIIEELERLHSSNPFLRLYFEILENTMLHQKQEMLIGIYLEEYLTTAGFEILHIESVESNISASAIMPLYLSNFKNICQAPWVMKHYDVSILNELGSGLSALKNNPELKLDNVLCQIIARPKLERFVKNQITLACRK